MYKGGISRACEIREVYHVVLKKHLRDGVNYKEAKELSYDAIELLYGVSKKRAYTIINSATRLINRNPVHSFLFYEKIDLQITTLKMLRDEKGR